MTKEEIQQSNKAKEFIKSNKSALIKRFAAFEIYKPDIHPISLFMAGSPGAGKTEISKRLIEQFKNKPVRIDADEIREMIPEYIGSNSYVFQDAVNKGVNMLYDYVLKNNINAILDGTFAYSGASNNIFRIDRLNKIVI